jgi:hypothetical protein
MPIPATTACVGMSMAAMPAVTMSVPAFSQFAQVDQFFYEGQTAQDQFTSIQFFSNTISPPVVGTGLAALISGDIGMVVGNAATRVGTENREPGTGDRKPGNGCHGGGT